WRLPQARRDALVFLPLLLPPLGRQCSGVLAYLYSSVVSPFSRSICLEQFVKQTPVINQALAQIFGPRFAVLVTLGDRMSRPKVLYDLRVIYRNVFSAVLEIGHWVTSCAHYITDQVIGAFYRLCRV